MAIHHPTPPLGGGERPRLPSAQVGPVTQAIRAMRTAEHGPRNFAQPLPHGICALSRSEVEDLIGGLIDFLDAMDGDADLEDGADLEAENEHGGDVQDEPHDVEPEENETNVQPVFMDGGAYARDSFGGRA